MKKLLITGASGFLGWNLCQLAQSTWQVYGTYHTKSVNLPGIQLQKIDLTNSASLQQLFQIIRPDAVIHTAAQSSPNDCQLNPSASHKVNVLASLQIAELCALHQIPYLFTSTELVFNGLNPPYKESDPVSPANLYGEQKAQAEQGILQRYPQATLCRMPLMFGQVPPKATSFIQPWIADLKAGKELKLFTDEYRTPVSATIAAQGLLLALEKQVTGILHLGGKERISRYDFGRLLTEILGLPNNIKPCQQKDVVMAASRPPDLSLDISKAIGLGYQPKSVRDELLALKTIL